MGKKQYTVQGFPKIKKTTQNNTLFQPSLTLFFLFEVYVSCCLTCYSISLEKPLKCICTQVSMKVNVFMQNNILCKSACSQIDFRIFLMVCLGCCFAFSYSFEKFKPTITHKILRLTLISM